MTKKAKMPPKGMPKMKGSHKMPKPPGMMAMNAAEMEDMMGGKKRGKK